MVSAPPGFGKTVALTQWFQSSGSRGTRTAWLCMDAADEPEVVVTYLAFSCQAAGLDLSNTDLLKATEHHSPLSIAMQTLLSCIERSESPWLLVIDDAERASRKVVCEVFEYLVRVLPANLTVAFGSRDPALLDFWDLRQRGLGLLIGTETLHFSRDEIRELWARAASDSQIRGIELRSGGWPALIALMVEQGSSPKFDATAAPSTGTSAVTTFFESRLIARLDPALRDLLFRLSLLERFSLPQAISLTGTPDLELRLGKLVTLGVVTRTADREGVDFAIHPLLCSYLAARFHAEYPTAARQFHRAAAQAYLALGQQLPAVRHAVGSQSEAFLGDIVEAVDPLLLGIRSGFPQLRQIVRLVPASLARQRARIGYAFVANLIKAGRLKEAKNLFCELDNRREAREKQGPSVALFERAICHSLLAVYKGTPITARDIEAIEQFVAATPSLAPMILSLAETVRSFVQAQSGQFTKAKDAAERAIAHAREGNSAYAAFFMYCDLGMITGVEGDPQRALRFFEEGDEACRSTVRLDERLAAIRDAFRLELEHEMNPNDAKSTARLKNICIRLPTLEGWLDVYASAFRTYSERLCLEGNLQGALAVLSAGMEHLREQEIEGIPDLLAAQRVLLLALADEVTAAKAEFNAMGCSGLSWPHLAQRPWRTAEALVEAAGSLDLATGEIRSRGILARAIDRAARSGNVRSEIRFRRLRSLLVQHHRATSEGDAAANRERLVMLEQRSGFVRSQEVYGMSSRAVLPGKRLARTTARRAEEVPRSEYLSAREREIMQRLKQGFSDKRIAQELGITAHGVRYHLKRIYAKLHARDRSEAQRKASRLGLL